MANAKRFAIPFAATGDKTTIPDATDPNGDVSYSQGWGPQYQLPDDDPDYKPVGRQEMNQAFNDVTGAVGEIQTYGIPLWVQPAGLIPPYPVNALVRHNDRVWLNGTANNTATPSSANGWLDVFGNGFVPTGAVMSFAMLAAPAGWLVCNGDAVSRVTYAGLFAAIGTTFGAGNGTTTFNLPDMRGMFPRGVDGGRGVDPNRTIGTTQESSNLQHSHSITVQSAGNHTHNTVLNRELIPSGPQQNAVYGDQQMQGTNTIPTTSAGNHTHNASAANSGGTESRPVNLAFQFCIKV